VYCVDTIIEQTDLYITVMMSLKLLQTEPARSKDIESLAGKLTCRPDDTENPVCEKALADGR
jgi:hypothetical protein